MKIKLKKGKRVEPEQQKTDEVEKRGGVMEVSSTEKPLGMLARLARVEKIQAEQGQKLDEILRNVMETNGKL